MAGFGNHKIGCQTGPGLRLSDGASTSRRLVQGETMTQTRITFGFWIAFALLASCPVHGDSSVRGKPNFIFVEYLKGDDALKRDYFYWELHRGSKPVQAARFGNWKAVRNGIDKPIEIYDLIQDSAESNDLAKSRPDLVEKAENIFHEAHRPDPNWPLNQRAESHRKRAQEAWAVKRARDRTKWIPPNAVKKLN